MSPGSIPGTGTVYPAKSEGPMRWMKLLGLAFLVGCARMDQTLAPDGRVIEKGPVAYSCLAVLQDGSVGLLYEGEHNPKEGVKRLRFIRFSLEWLTGGEDRLERDG